MCYSGYIGKACNISTRKCKNECSGSGLCVDGVCICDKLHVGDDCGKLRLNCSGLGIFNEQNYTCTCQQGYYGFNCESKKCPNDCKGNGDCLKNGTCVCKEGFTGFDCSISNLY